MGMRQWKKQWKIRWKKRAVLLLAVCLMAEPLQTFAVEEGAAEKSIDAAYADESGAISESGQASGTIAENGRTGAVWIMVDDQNRYEGMEKTYAEGYVPKVENGVAYVVLPLITDCPVSGDSLKVSVDLGDVDTMPFVSKNYVRDVKLGKEKVNGGAETRECYLVSFALELKESRSNGSYPVVFTVKGKDGDGNAVKKKFTVYVTIRDGSAQNGGQNGSGADENGTNDSGTGGGSDGGGSGTVTASGSGKEAPTFAPKVVVISTSFSKNPIQDGDEVQADITLKNTSTVTAVRNMTVTVSAENTYFSLRSASDTIYVDSIPAGQTYVASYIYKVNGGTPQGQYTWTLEMDYADSEGTTVSESGKVQVSVEQPVKVAFDPLNISSLVQVADVVEVQVQAMNLGRGKIYNVRAVIEADGLKPQGTIFIGDMEAGTTATGSAQVSVTSLSGENLYGDTTGTVTFYYEDESGTEYTDMAEFTTTIQSPFSEKTDEPEDVTGQWWILMAAVAGILCAIAVFTGVRRLKRGRLR